MKHLLLVILMFSLMVGCSEYLDAPEQLNLETFTAVCEQVDRHFPFFEYTQLNWDSVVTVYENSISDKPDDEELFNTISNLLTELNDAHTNIFAPSGTGGNVQYFAAYKNNTIDDIEHYFSSYKSINNAFGMGFIKDENIAYLQIKTLAGDDELFEKADSLVDLIQTTEGLIIDVRANRGGLISNSEIVITNLTNEQLQPCQFRYRNGTKHTDFSEWTNYTIDGSTNKNSYPKPIMILTNRTTYSAAEWFVLSMQCLTNVTCIGDTTGGGSAKPIFRELPNGWMLRVSNTQCQLPSGNDFQNVGLFPDIPLWLSDEDIFNNTDAILEKAIETITTNSI